ncbi:xanthine dehydrogenase family protein molybdopterin-binding subunit [Desulfobacter vibrioformis]|uniref:xanthine dehydrogenase family protein molybdopterin-binding subunit n=1 Tax=Desulfobacter vibrioformis TaxID=34031 RepID=UPI0006913AAA|nr:xanthine dehydrogenase family protein molybdopterin-binding subunit [Desulfobacter vibrioformis]
MNTFLKTGPHGTAHPETAPPQIGLSQPRPDAAAKIRGTEKFTIDLPGKDDLWAGVKRAGIPHARLISIDTEKARALPGVAAVLTHQDIQGSNRQGVVRQDQPVLVDDRIRHCGDALALVVARDKTALGKALSLITFEAEVLPGIFSIEEALAEGAPVLHPDHETGNILLAGALTQGQGLDAFKACAWEVTISLTVPVQEHVCLETECGRAIFKDNRLFITASTQTPFRDRNETAQALGLSQDRVQVTAPFLGGGFGGKDGITVQTLLGLAALACPGKHVAMVWDREESFIASPKRHRANLSYRLGLLADGSFHALEARADFDTGPYDHLGGVVLALGLEHAGGPYAIPHTHIEGRAVYTNNPVGGAFRGFGVPQVTAAMEQVVDLAAKRVNLSPMEIRLKNCLTRGQKAPAGNTLARSTGIRECLAAVAAHPLWQGAGAWLKKAPAHTLRGCGLACAMHGMGFGPVVPDVAHAKLELTAQGRFRVYCGVSDMGQGNAATFLHIAGDLLCQPIDNIDLILPDTDQTLPCGSSSASRTTFTFAHALTRAAATLKERIVRRAADSLMVDDPEEFTLVPGELRHLTSGRAFPLAVMAGFMNPDERMAVSRYRAPTARDHVTDNKALKMHGVPHAIFSYTVHFARVEIDTLTGGIRVDRYLAATDCGRLINPALVEQQMHGAIAQGLGYALFEDFLTEGGQTLTRDLSTYIIPGALDLPPMELISVATREQDGPFGMKGVGEVGIDAPLACVANAVADACGKRPGTWPLTRVRMLALLKEKP